MLVKVHRVSIPASSSIGFAFYRDEDAVEHRIVGDQRPLREIGEVIARTGAADELPEIETDDAIHIPLTGGIHEP